MVRENTTKKKAATTKKATQKKGKQKEKEVVKDLYINKLWQAKDIAEMLDISEQTISKWKKVDEATNEDWDKMREKTVGDPIKLKTAILNEMVSIASGEEPKLNADGLYKLYRILEALNDRINPGTVAATMKLYDEFLVTRDKELAAISLPHNKAFINHCINQYGQ